MPTHMPVLVDFWEVENSDSPSDSPTALDTTWKVLCSIYDADPASAEIKTNSTYCDSSDVCYLTFYRKDADGKIVMSVYPSVL